MRKNNKYLLQTRDGLWLSDTGQLMPDKISAGRYNRRSGELMARAKFGIKWEDHVTLIELDIEEFRLLNLAVSRKIVTRRKRKHLLEISQLYNRRGLKATPTLIALLHAINTDKTLEELKIMARRVRMDYIKSIKFWERYHREKLAEITLEMTEETE